MWYYKVIAVAFVVCGSSRIASSDLLPNMVSIHKDGSAKKAGVSRVTTGKKGGLQLNLTEVDGEWTSIDRNDRVVSTRTRELFDTQVAPISRSNSMETVIIYESEDRDLEGEDEEDQDDNNQDENFVKMVEKNLRVHTEGIGFRSNDQGQGNEKFEIVSTDYVDPLSTVEKALKIAEQHPDFFKDITNPETFDGLIESDAASDKRQARNVLVQKNRSRNDTDSFVQSSVPVQTESSMAGSLPSSAQEAYLLAFKEDGSELYTPRRTHLDSDCSDYYSAYGDQDQSAQTDDRIQKNEENSSGLNNKNSLEVQNQEEDGSERLHQRPLSDLHNGNPGHLAAETFMLSRLDTDRQYDNNGTQQKGPGVWTLLGRTFLDAANTVADSIGEAVFQAGFGLVGLANCVVYSDGDDEHEKID